MSGKIYGENPMSFSREIAAVEGIGMNGAIVIQQVHYWISQYEKKQDAQHFHNGRYWHYNTYDEWRDLYFPFWSVETVKNVFRSLEALGVLISGNYGKGRMKWYSIDYAELDARRAANKQQTGETAAG